MATTSETDTCPICTETPLHQARCGNAACAFVVTTCPRCDREQVVRAFVADHEKDCAHSASALLAAVTSSVAFRRPARKAA